MAIAQILTKKNEDKSFYLLADIKKEIKKTKVFNKFLNENNIKNVLVVGDKETIKNIYKSTRNIRDLKLINEKGTNVYDIMKFKNILITLTSMKDLEKRILNEKN